MPPTEHRRFGHDRIRLELSDRLRQLPVIARGRHHPGASAPIQEMHDFLGHFRRLERQHDPRYLIHGVLPCIAREVRGACLNGSHRRRHPGAQPDELCPLPLYPAFVEDAPREHPLRLPYRPPFAADTLLAFLRSRALPGVEEVRGGTYRRSMRTSDGGPAVIALTPDPVGDHVTLEMSEGRASGTTELVHAAKRMFDLEADPIEIDATLSRDPKLAPLVRRIPGIRVPGSFDSFELVVRAIFGQQVSVSGARTSLGRFAARFGTPLDPPIGTISHLFPSAGPGRRPSCRSVRDAPSPCGGDPARRRAGRPRVARPLRRRADRRDTAHPRRGSRDRTVDARLCRDASPPGSGRLHRAATSACARGSKPWGCPPQRRSSRSEPNGGAHGVRTP